MKYIKEHKDFVLFLTLTAFLLFISLYRLDYEILSVGGTSQLDDKFTINGENIEASSYLNSVFVYSTYKPSIIFYVLSYFDKDAVREKKEGSDFTTPSPKENDYIGKLYYTVGNKTAYFAVHKLLNPDTEPSNLRYHVNGILNEVDTNLVIGDEIIQINDYKMGDFLTDSDYLDSIESDAMLSITTKDGSIKYLNTFDSDKTYNLGIAMLLDIEFDDEYKVDFLEKDSYGDSGSFVTALQLYQAITKIDLIKERKIVGTGSIFYDGTIFPIGGLEFKIKAAIKDDMDLFLVPFDNYEEEIEMIKEYNDKIKIIPIHTLEEAIEYLKQD